MNSTEIGNALEHKIYAMFEKLISSGQFWAERRCCKLFRKKAYFSKDRNSEIVFDIALELYLPGATEYSMLCLIECKNYGHAVPIDDVEEFYAKIQQISSATKGIIVTTRGFQKSSLAYSKAKGIGLIKYFQSGEYKWELRRSSSASIGVLTNEQNEVIEQALLGESNQTTYFDFYLSSPLRFTNSVLTFFEDLAHFSQLTEAQIRQLSPTRNRSTRLVGFLDQERIEAVAKALLAEIAYQEGEVSLEQICELEHSRNGLKVIRSNELHTGLRGESVLGAISFDPLRIDLFRDPAQHRGREKFTLAHELSHHLLEHGRYLTREYCTDRDFEFRNAQHVELADLQEMERQANALAACILLPQLRLIRELEVQLTIRDIHNKGFGALYVDRQRVNQDAFYQVTSALMRVFGVSRSVVKYRLERLDLLRDARSASEMTTDFFRTGHRDIGWEES